MKYFAIIVHHGSASLTNFALRSLEQTKQAPDQIIVIDHGDQPFAANYHSSTLVIRPANNAGYGSGINRGLGVLVSWAEPQDIIMVMNNDLTFTPDAMMTLRRWWANHSGLAVVACASRLAGEQLTGRGRVNLFTGRTQLEKTSQPFSTSTSLFSSFLPYLDGAFLSAPYEVFLRTAGLPDDYFLYWEDVLFSRRLARLNIPQLTFDQIQFSHQPKATTSPHHLYYLVRNGALFLAQETPLPWRWYWQLVNRLRLIYHLFNRRQPIVRAALRDALNNLRGQRTIDITP